MRAGDPSGCDATGVQPGDLIELIEVFADPREALEAAGLAG